MRIKTNVKAKTVKLSCTLLTIFFALHIFPQTARAGDDGSSPLIQSPDLTAYSKIDYNVVRPNEAGQIMVLMYHGLDDYRQSAPYMRTVDGFKSDLQKLYDEGFRTIPISDLINNDIKVEAGCSPVVITFDDAMSSAFSFIEKDGKLVPKPNCAVDIMNKFAEKYPDFGRHAVFFINKDGRPPFKGKGTDAELLKYLVDNGYELGNHTTTHPSLSGLNAKQIQKEMAGVEKFVQEHIPGYKMLCMSYPYGLRPSNDLRKYVLEGEYDGVEYKYDIALKEAPGNATAVVSNVNFDPLNVPRVRGTDTDVRDLGWYLKEYKKRPELKYISDGNPYVISVPADCSQNVNTSAIKNRILNVYEIK